MSLFWEETKKMFWKYKLLHLSACLLIISVFSVYAKDMLPVSSEGFMGLSNEMPEGLYVWQQILSNTSINIYLLIFSLAVGALAVVPDSINGMDDLLQSTRKGKYALPFVKPASVIIVTFIFVAVIIFSELGIASIKYTLENWSVPLQSLSDYATTQKSLTIMQAYLLKSFCMIFGYTALAILSLVTSKILKGKISIALVISLSSVLLPVYLAPNTFNTEKLYKLPLPISPILGGAFLRPTLTEEGTGTIFFKELSYNEILLTLGGVVFLCILSICVYLIMTRVINFPKIRVKIIKPSLALALCLIIFTLTACDSNFEYQGDSSTKYVALNESYFFDLHEKRIANLNPTPMGERTLFFIQGDVAFWSYANETLENLYTLNLSTYEENNIYKRERLIDYDALLGLEEVFPKISQSKINFELPRFNEDSWYSDGHIYTMHKDSYVRVNLNNKEKTPIFTAFNLEGVVRYENKLYIVENQRGLFVADLNGENTRLIDERIKDFNFRVDNEVVYFLEADKHIYLSQQKEAVWSDIEPLNLHYAVFEKLLFSKNDEIYQLVKSFDKYSAVKIMTFPEAFFFHADEQFLYFYEDTGSSKSVYWCDYNGNRQGESRVTK